MSGRVNSSTCRTHRVLTDENSKMSREFANPRGELVDDLVLDDTLFLNTMKALLIYTRIFLLQYEVPFRYENGKDIVNQSISFGYLLMIVCETIGGPVQLPKLLINNRELLLPLGELFSDNSSGISLTISGLNYSTCQFLRIL